MRMNALGMEMAGEIKSARTRDGLRRAWFRILGAACACLAALAAWGPMAAFAAPWPEVRLDRPVVLAGQEQVVNLLVRFEIPEADAAMDRDRPPLNLAVVIDRSGSMSDRGKLEYAKRAVELLVDQLRPTDRLAVVEYDDRVGVLWPSSPLTSKEAVKELVRRLTPRGCTDLAGGLAEGLAQARTGQGGQGAGRVILLSDGLANRGVTNPREIAAMASRGRAHGVAVTTMGLGLSYDEDLMQAVAEHGGGGYYYVESPAQMPRIYAQELANLFHTVARDVSLRFEPGPGVRKVTVYGYPSRVEGGATVIGMEDLHAGESRTVLLSLALSGAPQGDLDAGRLVMAYREPKADAARSRDFPVVVRGADDADLVTRSMDHKAAAEAALVLADQRHEEAVRAFESGRKADAVAQLDRLRTDLGQAFQDHSDPRLQKKLEAVDMEGKDMERAENDQQYRQTYIKKSKEAFYRAKQGKRGKYLLQPGASGLEVERLQRRLADLGHYNGPVDGRYDDEVRAAVEAFQHDRQLDVDGMAGPRTLRELGLY